MLENLCIKAVHPENLSAIIVDNTNGNDDSIQKLEEFKIKKRILNLDCKGRTGSKGHAWALDHAMRYLNTEYSVVVDPDIHVFKNGWDEICLTEMANTGSFAMGAPYPPWKTGKYHDFPSPPFCFFHVNTMKMMKNGWEPYSSTFHKNIWTRCIRQIGRLGFLVNRKRFTQHLFIRKYAILSEKLFGVYSQDTGWKVAQEAKLKKLKAIVFDTILSIEEVDIEEQSTHLSSLIKEYEAFGYEKQLFLVHKYGTGGLLWKTERGPDHRYWSNCIHKIESNIDHNNP